MEWIGNATNGNSNLVVGAGIALITVLVVKYVNASVEASHARAYAEAKARRDAAEAARKQPDIQRTYFTLDELKAYTGEDGNPIYIGVLDEIYDVSLKRDFYGPGASYHLFAGRDASRALAKLSFEPEDLDNEDLSDLNSMDEEALQDWVMKFSVYNSYPNVGRILRHQDLTREQLKAFNGKDNKRKTVYVGLNGKIYDVTLDGAKHYGPGGSYEKFAGRDVSKALAMMSFDQQHLDDPSLTDLDEKQQKTLADWEAKFDSKYPVVGKLL